MQKLRQAVSRRPFVPLRLTLHAGDPVIIRHPESIAMGEERVAVVLDHDLPIIFEARMIVSIAFLKNGRTRPRS